MTWNMEHQNTLKKCAKLRVILVNTPSGKIKGRHTDEGTAGGEGEQGELSRVTVYTWE